MRNSAAGEYRFSSSFIAEIVFQKKIKKSLQKVLSLNEDVFTFVGINIKDDEKIKNKKNRKDSG